jgi:hypothetical protein
MRTIETKVYQFEELSEKAQEKAIQNLCGIKVDNLEWWEFVYEDAKDIGLKITGFDIDRNRRATGEFIQDAIYTAEKIKIEHGEQCQTFKTACNFLDEFIPIATKWEEENAGFYFLNENLGDEMIQEFLTSLLEDYFILLQKEYEYQTSSEAIKETILCNEYEFTEDGKLI